MVSGGKIIKIENRRKTVKLMKKLEGFYAIVGRKNMIELRLRRRK